MIRKEQGNIYIRAAYNAAFVRQMRNLGAVWEAPEWVTDERNIDLVRGILMEVYGKNDIETEKIVDIRVEYPNGIMSATQSSLYVCGRPAVVGFGRDSGARPGAGVSVVSGDITSGGSMRNWYVKVSAGTVLIIRDVPKSKADSYSGSGILTILEKQAKLTVGQLREEESRLLVALAEIQRQIADAT